MNTILTILAVLPAVVLMVYIFRKDSVEHEPLGLLGALFLGGCVSVLPVIFCELIADALLQTIFGNGITYAFMENFFGVALMEEGWKLIFLLLIAWRSKHFDYLFDGIVYAVFVSLGFAAVENIMYVTGQDSFANGVALAGTRALLSVPLHCFCGVFMGFFLGHAKNAKVNGNIGAYRHARFMTIAIPVFIHGFYDFCLSVNSDLLFAAFFVFVIAIYIYAFRRVKQSAKEDRSFTSTASHATASLQQNCEFLIQDNFPINSPAVTNTQVSTGWTCEYCGSVNKNNYCTGCGAPRPIGVR